MENQCSSCRYATMCPNRELYTKIFNHRNEVMVHIADDDGEIDLSKEATLRIEHRYLDGPGLGELYHDLGLTAPQMCCILPFNRCVVKDRHPYDEDLCATLNDPNHSFMKDADGIKTLWSCKSCYNYKPFEPSDYSKLGGTVFSTFGITEMKVKLGDVVDLTQVETPKGMILGYSRVYNIGESTHTVKEVNDSVICYYTYGMPVKTVVPDSYMTEDQITQKGLRHKIELFYNELSHVYPSLRDGESGITMNVYLDGAIAGIGRVDVDGNVVTAPGGIIRFEKELMEPNLLRTMFGEDIITKSGETIQTNNGYSYAYLTKSQVNGSSLIAALNSAPNIKSIDISNGNYRACNLVSGDTLLLRVELDGNYMLDMPVMASMCYPANLTYSYKITHRTIGGEVRNIYYISMIIPDVDIDYQMVLVRASRYMDVATYPRINHLHSWDSQFLAWAAREVTVMNENVPMKAYPPIPPRMWSKNVMPYDETPWYDTELPGPDDIIRPCYRLLGYTDEIDGRYRHNPNILIRNAAQTTCPDDVYFLGCSTAVQKQKIGFIDYAALWKLDYYYLRSTLEYGVQHTEGMHLLTEEEIATALPVMMSELVASKQQVADPTTMTKTSEPIYAEMSMEYSDQNNTDIVKALVEMMPEGELQWKIYLCPSESKSVRIGNAFLDTEKDAILPPDGTIEIPHEDGPSTYLTLESCELGNHELTVGADNYLVVNLYPDNSYGLSPRYQNFVTLVIKVSMLPRKTDLMLNLHSDFDPFSIITAGDVRSYSFSNIAPNDIGNLAIQFDDTVANPHISLTGSAASKYELGETKSQITVEYSLRRTILDTKAPDVVLTDVLRKYDAKTFHLIPSLGHYISEIRINDKILFTVPTDTNGEPWKTVVQYDADRLMRVMVIYDQVTGEIELSCISIDLDLEIVVEESPGTSGNPDACNRCRGYVDTDTVEYSWLGWIPNCEKYSPED